MRIADIAPGEKVLTKTSQYVSAAGRARSRFLDPGSLIMSIAATVGRPAITGIPTCIHDGFVALLNLREIDQDFLYYVLTGLETEFRSAGQTGSQANLNTSIVRGQVVRVPSRRQQQAIAQVLADVDGLIASLNRLIAKKRDIRLGAMQQLLTGRTRLPGFEETWALESLGALTTWLSGGTPSRARAEFWNGDIPWISASSLNSMRIHSSDQHLTAAGVAAGSRMAPMDSTLLLVRGSALHNTIKLGRVVGPVCFNQDVKALVPGPQLDPGYLSYALAGKRSEMLRRVTSATNSAGVLETRVVQAIEIPVPSREEQHAIATVLSDLDVEIDALEARLAKTRDIKQGTIQALLTGRTRSPVGDEQQIADSPQEAEAVVERTEAAV